MPTGAVSEGESAPVLPVQAGFVRVERVTGIEPALSAWEVHCGGSFPLFPSGFRGLG